MNAGDGENESDSMMRSSGVSGGVYGRPGQGVGRPINKRNFFLVVVVVFVIGMFAVSSFSPQFSGKKGLRGTNAVDPKLAGGPFAPNTWDILLIADMDKKSKVDDTGKKFRSVLQAGQLSRTPSLGAVEESYSVVKWGDTTDLFSGHNEAGRGMELSELILYRGAMMTVDDRTGIVFEIVEDDDGRHMAPRYIIPEGDGTVDKGMKLEWATVKDGKLVLGSIGKEFTDSTGAITGYNNNWVDLIDEHGNVVHEDWTEKYEKLRAEAGASFPGYMIHESAAWSDVLEKWVFLPRRLSDEAYDDMKDEQRGSNTILIVDEDFRKVEVRHAGENIPTHGFSSFKFVPGTGDNVVVALKSEENENANTQNSFLTVFTLDGRVLLEEVEVPGAMKFEGIEILPVLASSVDGGNSRHLRR